MMYKQSGYNAEGGDWFRLKSARMAQLRKRLRSEVVLAAMLQ